MGRFNDRLQAQWDQGKFVCVGLDPNMDKIYKQVPTLRGQSEGLAGILVPYLKEIVNATHDVVCAYKPNWAFFLEHGSYGLEMLEQVVAYIRRHYPNVVVIIDMKVGDIDSSNLGYAQYPFVFLDADAITVHPYMGHVAMKPLLDCEDRGVIVLVRTSNEGAGELQNRQVTIEGYQEAVALDIPSAVSAYMNGYDQPKVPLYQYFAASVRDNWNYNDNCAVVVGATVPDELTRVRELVGDGIPILIPGVGAQGGSLELATQNGMNSRGDGFIINASRSVLYADALDGQSFAEAARAEVVRMSNVINLARIVPDAGNDV